MKYLKNERKLTIEDRTNGLYYIHDDIIPIQLLERKKLSSEENLFLRNLGSGLNAADILHTLNLCLDQELINEKSVYLDRVLEANKMILKEVKKMSTTMDFIWEVVEESGRLEERIEKKVEEQIEKRDKEMVERMMLKGESIERIAELTNLPLETVRELSKPNA